jgi:hypothetical protein
MRGANRYIFWDIILANLEWMRIITQVSVRIADIQSQIRIRKSIASTMYLHRPDNSVSGAEWRLAKRVCAFLLQQLDGSEYLDAPLSTFTVSPGKRYRFRVAYVGGGRACPIALSVGSHMLRVISLDGHPITPREVTSVVMAAGQHLIVDFKFLACSSTTLRVVRDGLQIWSASANVLDYQWPDAWKAVFHL